MAQSDDARDGAPPKRGSSGSGARRSGGGSAKARRKAARLAAVQALYQIDLTGTNAESVLGEFIKHRLGHEVDGDTYVAADPQLFSDILRGASARRAELDEMLGSCLDAQWPVDRLELLMRAILRAGAFELLVHVDTHPRIVISEYVDVSHAFFAGREPAMVNGVLDKLARAIRAEDLATPDPSRAAR
ncbi:transcription antitermination factor NusB [Skermanella sp. TT6]|uniref:Transcription antitermination protein NusB n=1 Tax=Skermanella cutis TaxID=2775420 RepID=A0ABX7B4C4_9PROT|nr:transcription antitermination factor NusB [Skermanella sp. TT6]QQP88984.1 transcription antitermination factor NusB [Skermanella sp. TT6]